MLCSFEKRKVLTSTELDQPFHLREDNLSEVECLFQVTQQMSVLAGQSADPPSNPRLVLLTYSPCPSLGSRWEKSSVPWYTGGNQGKQKQYSWHLFSYLFPQEVRPFTVLEPRTSLTPITYTHTYPHIIPTWLDPQNHHQFRASYWQAGRAGWSTPKQNRVYLGGWLLQGRWSSIWKKSSSPRRSPGLA